MNKHEVPAYRRFLEAVDPGGDEAAEFDARYRRGDVDLSRIAVCRQADDADTVVGDLRCVPVGDGEYVLTELRSLEEARITHGDLTSMLDHLLRPVGADATVLSRVDKGSLFPAYERALREHGFRSAGDRVEFRSPIGELDLEQRRALRWRSYSGELRDELARVFLLCNTDSSDAFDDPLKEFAELCTDCEVDAHPGRLQLGYDDGAPVGLFFAYTVGEWGTVPFMGVVPDMRGRGFGADVHAKAVSQLATEGATTYHDGTSCANLAMVRLFEKMGCTKLSEMREFKREPRGA
jgi:GNAT superfamily N-acetyltransferase